MGGPWDRQRVSVFEVSGPVEWPECVWSVLRQRESVSWNLLPRVRDAPAGAYEEDKWCLCWPARLFDARGVGGVLRFESMYPYDEGPFHFTDQIQLSNMMEDVAPRSLAVDVARSYDKLRTMPIEGVERHEDCRDDVLRTVLEMLVGMAEDEGDPVDDAIVSQIRATLALLR